jgi:NAD(P)-dependent dehydrogenase (short-subunit alcohol dehydrogenase family)
MSGEKTGANNRSIGGISAGLVDGFLREGYKVVATSREANRKLTTSDQLVLREGDISNRL